MLSQVSYGSTEASRTFEASNGKRDELFLDKISNIVCPDELSFARYVIDCDLKKINFESQIIDNSWNNCDVDVQDQGPRPVWSVDGKLSRLGPLRQKIALLGFFFFTYYCASI
jgi:hypothetical protein